MAVVRQLWRRSSVAWLPSRGASGAFNGCCRLIQRNYSSLSKESAGKALEHCVELVKRYEYEQYCCAQLAPNGAWAPLITLRAFNIETARIKDKSSTPEIGQIRLHWWEDALDALYKGEESADLLKQPVTAMMYVLLRRYHLPKELFQEILKARSRDLSSQPPDSISELVQYADSTQGCLLDLGLHTLTMVDQDFKIAHEAVRHAGRCAGLVTLIRATPHLAVRGLTYIPKELIASQRELEQELYTSGKNGQLSDRLKIAVETLANVAEAELEAARALRARLTNDSVNLLFAVLPAATYLRSLRRKNFDVFNVGLIDPTALSRLQFLLQLRWSSWRRTF